MKLISISGLDGSGKSTQIEMLKNNLESQGKKVFYFHAIAFSFPQKIKEFKNKYCLICRFTNACKRKDSDQEKSVVEANWLQIQLRKIALAIDILRFKSFKDKLEKQGYDYLVSDRYFYDTLINITYLESKSAAANHKKIIRPDFALYLNASPENIMSRDRVPDQGLEYLQKKKLLLDAFSKDNKLFMIDGNRDKNEIHTEIKSIIFSN